MMSAETVMSPSEIARVLDEHARKVENGVPRLAVPIGHPERGIVERALADLALHLAGEVAGSPDCERPDAEIEYTRL